MIKFSAKMERVIESFSSKDREQLQYCMDIASNVLKDHKRSDDTPFINHVTAVVEIVACELGLKNDSICAVFIHEACRVNRDIIGSCRSLPQDIVSIAEGLNKISQIKPKDTGLQAENYRKLIISYSVDPRVTLLKLADRLEIMRSMDIFTKSKQLKKSTETLMLYAPLAHQLGLYNLKSELEDLSFKYSDPESYRTIVNKLKSGEQERKRLADLFVKPIELELKKARVKYILKSRTKSAYSIYKKMQNQQIPFEAVADLFAIRVIIDAPYEQEKDYCWRVYSIVTSEYVPDTKRLRDWITVPKDNGYESLHTTVKTKDGNVIEVQIRTKRMDDIAENGYASHWSYKGVKSEDSLTEWLNGVKNILEKRNISQSLSSFNLALDEIFVFTPDEDLRRLPSGSSVLDFAFDIHTNLGVKCSGAKINGKPVSIRERLKTGDVVEIMSSKNQRPSADWLNFVVTSKARARIKQKLKEEDGKRASEGRELLERRVANWKLDFNDTIFNALLKKYKYKTASEFYIALALEQIDIFDVKSFLSSDESKRTIHEEREIVTISESKTPKKEAKEDYLIIDEKVNNVSFKLAKCCNPIMGDDVFGFVTIKEGIKIHRISCPNASRLFDNYPYRIQRVKWRESGGSHRFNASIKISGYGDSSVTQGVMEVLSSLGVTLRSFNINDEKGKLDARLVVSVTNNQQLDKFIFNLKKIKGIKSVARLSNI